MLNSKKQADRLSNLRLWRGKTKTTVIISLLLLLILTSCAEQKTPVSEVKNIITCRQEIATYGDALECLIRLDEAQYAR